MRVHKGKALVAGVAALALALTACSSSKSSSSGKTRRREQERRHQRDGGHQGHGQLQELRHRRPPRATRARPSPAARSPTCWRRRSPAGTDHSPSNVFEVAEVEDGILPGVFLAGSDLKPFLNTDLMVSADADERQPADVGLQDQARRGLGRRHADQLRRLHVPARPSDGTTCPKCGAASTSGYNRIASMTGSDNGKTVTVVMKTPFADWQSMFGALYPAHIAAQHGGITTPAGLTPRSSWFDKNVPTYSGGPMKISGYVKDTSITEVPNPKWYGKTKSSLDKLVFRIITDQTQEADRAAEQRGAGALPAAERRPRRQRGQAARMSRPTSARA